MELRIAYLRPKEVSGILTKKPVIYIPIAPLEWHGPHLPLGTDPLIAEKVAIDVCKKIGGLIWPTMYWGTERPRSSICLDNLGFKRDQYIVGMDFPGNSLPSAYCREDIFGILVRENLRLVKKIGAKFAVIVNGHGAQNQLEITELIAKEFSMENDILVQSVFVLPKQENDKSRTGHATGCETSMIQFVYPQTVDISQLPPQQVPLKYVEYAIVDSLGFSGKATNGIVKDDPRTNASPERGRKIFEMVANEIRDELEKSLTTIKIIC